MSDLDFGMLVELFRKDKVSTFELKDYNHEDYLWGENCHNDLYGQVVDIVNGTL